jgi:hypothetical protein
MKHLFRKWLAERKDKIPSPILPQEVIERILKKHHKLKSFFQETGHLLIFRSTPTLQDPVYEIQLTRDLKDRLETYAWLWVDALEGKIIKMLPED